MHHFHKETFTLHNRNYAYWINKKKINNPTLIISGYTGTHVDFLPLGEHIGNNSTVIVPDLPGWGASDRLITTHTIGHYADFFSMLLTHLKIDKITLVGHCLGCAIAITLALKHKRHVRQLFLVNPPYEEQSLIYQLIRHTGEFSKKAPKSFRPLFFLWRNRFTAFIVGMFLFHFRSYKKRLRYVIRDFMREGEVESVVEENAMAFYKYNWKMLSHINIPLHMIHGRHDILISAKQVDALMKLSPLGTTLDYFPDGGHLIPLEHPVRLGNLITDYMNMPTTT